MKSRGLAAVTGSSRGLGFSIALKLAREGYDLILINRHSERLEQAAAEIRLKTTRTVELAIADLLDEDACLKAVQGKPIDVLVNCGIYQGSGMNSRIDLLTKQQLRDTFQANVLTQVFMVQEVLKYMMKVNKGRIFQLVSGSSRTKPVKAIDKGGFQSFAYSSSKAAIAKMVPLLALELESSITDIKCFNIDPGLVITDKMRSEGTAKRFEKWGTASPDHTAEVVAYLCIQTSPLVQKLSGEEFVDAPSIYQELFSSKL